MAQALSIVGEGGVDGIEYNALIAMLIANRDSARSKVFQSQKMRISLCSAHVFTPKDFEQYLILAWRFGLVIRSGYKEVEWVHGKNKSSYEVEDEIIRLTQAGWEFVDTNDQPLAHRWGANVVENVPTVLLSVFLAWVLFRLGLS